MDIEKIGLEQHAMLFGWLAHETVRRFGDGGRRVVREGVRRYGEERGRRMAERDRDEGDEHDLAALPVEPERHGKEPAHSRVEPVKGAEPDQHQPWREV